MVRDSWRARARRPREALAAAALAATAAVLATAVLATAGAGSSVATGGPKGDRRPAGQNVAGQNVAGQNVAAAEPFSILLSRRSFSLPPSTAQCVADYGVRCYSPAQIQTAYEMLPLYAKGDDGRGETIVVVDSFGSPTIRADLAAFDRGFDLPPPPSFRIVAPAGPLPPWTGGGVQSGWGVETSLDVEWAHAMAPGAALVLVETPVAETEGTVGFPQIIAAERWAILHLDPAVISQSFGATEQTFPSRQAIYRLRGAYQLAEKRHVTVLASSGDAGATSQKSDSVQYYTFRVVSWPSSDPLVTSVGGTRLDLSASGKRLSPDTVWNDSAALRAPAASGGGVSSVFPRPAWQARVARVVGARRGVPDVSLSAAESAGALVYMSFHGAPPGYSVVGGTSWASPLFSGIVAIADQVAGRHLGLLNPALYALADRSSNGIVDIATGNNTVSFFQGNSVHTVVGYRATKGYDLASGLGTVDGAELVEALAASAPILREHPRHKPERAVEPRPASKSLQDFFTR